MQAKLQEKPEKKPKQDVTSHLPKAEAKTEEIPKKDEKADQVPADPPRLFEGEKPPANLVDPKNQNSMRTSKKETATRGRKKANSKLWGDGETKTRKGSNPKGSNPKGRKPKGRKPKGRKPKGHKPKGSMSKPAKAKTESAVEKPRRGAPKSKAKAKAKAKVHPGCSRCRFAAKGCKTCLKPGFKPRGPRGKPLSDTEPVDVD